MVVNKKLVYGVGINDVDYVVTKSVDLPKVNGKRKRKQIWVCPYYNKWIHILERCFSKKFHLNNPTYTGCIISEEWLRLSNFIKWVDSQPNRDWMNCEPDKDLLFQDNKIYNANTVVFIDKRLNTFLMTSAKSRGKYMIGVCIDKRSMLFQAQCGNPFTRKGEYLGSFKTEYAAHLVWKQKKCEHANKLAEMQQDSRVAEALRQRYSKDTDWSNK